MRRISSSSSMSRTCSYTRTPSARAQSQGVAFLPVPQSKVKDAAALGGQQLEGQPDQLGFHADAQLIVEQVTPSVSTHSSLVKGCASRSTARRRASVVLPEPGSPQVRCSVGSCPATTRIQPG